MEFDLRLLGVFWFCLSTIRRESSRCSFLLTNTSDLRADVLLEHVWFGLAARPRTASGITTYRSLTSLLSTREVRSKLAP